MRYQKYIPVRNDENGNRYKGTGVTVDEKIVSFPYSSKEGFEQIQIPEEVELRKDGKTTKKVLLKDVASPEDIEQLQDWLSDAVIRERQENLKKTIDFLNSKILGEMNLTKNQKADLVAGANYLIEELQP